MTAVGSSSGAAAIIYDIAPGADLLFQTGIDDNVCARRGQIGDSVCVAGYSIDTGLKKKVRTWRNIINDLQHGAPFIDAENKHTTKRRFTVQHGNSACWQISG